MKLVLQIKRSDNGRADEAFLCFDKQAMVRLREMLGTPNFRRKGDHVHLFSESYGISESWDTPPMSDDPIFEGCDIVENLELYYLGDDEEVSGE